MPKAGILAAIDVGTTKVCTIIASAGEEGAFRVLGVGVVPTRGMRKGTVVNLEETRESVRESVRKAEHVSGMKIESVYVGITGNHVESANTRGAIAVTRGDKKVHTQDLKRVLEETRSVKVMSDRRLLHVIPRTYVLDGQAGVKSPVGMHGFRLDADAHLVTAAGASIQNLVKCIRGVGLEVEDLVLEPLAAAEAVLRSDEKETGVALVDIGGGTTDVAIFKDGSVWFSSVIGVGGYQVSRDLAIGLSIPFDMAEQLKLKYGNLNLSSEEGKVKVDGSELGLNDHQEFLLKDLNDIIASRVEEMLMLVYGEIPQPGYLNTLIPAGLVLAGGTANLPGLDAMASGLFHLPVRVGVPQNVYGLADILYNPAYATSVGLLLWGAKKYMGEWRASQSGIAPRLARSLRQLVSRRK